MNGTSLTSAREARAQPIPILLALLATLIALSSTAAKPDTSNWKCAYCPFELGHRAAYQTAAGFVSDTDARFGNANGLDEEGTYIVLNGDGRFSNHALQVDWSLADAALDSRLVAAEVDKFERYSLGFSYQRSPYRLHDSTATPFVGSTSGLRLPDGWTRAALTSGMADLSGSLRSRDIGQDRDAIGMTARVAVGPGIELFGEYRRQDQDGVDSHGGAFFTQASLLPRRIDHETDELDLGVAYQGQRGYAQLEFYGSRFENRDTALVWDNPFTSLAGAEHGSLALPPDNGFSQMSVGAGYRFGATTRLRVTAARGRMRQDARLQAYTVNPTLNVSALPRTRLDGEVDTSNVHVALSSRPFRPVTFKLAYALDDRDNDTPVLPWSRVIVDSVTSGQTETNVPYSFRREKLSSSADYVLRPGVRLGAGFERKTWDRNFQEVAEQTEDTGWGNVRWRIHPSISLRARLGTAKRENNRYNTVVAQGFGQNPALRKYHLAHRFREFGEASVTASHPRKPLSVTLTAAFANDDYSQSKLGLLRSDEVRYAADASWSASSSTHVHADIGYQKTAARQAGSSQFGSPDWFVTHRDEYASIGFGFQTQINERVDISASYQYGRGQSAIKRTVIGATATPLPDLDTRINTIRASAGYRRSPRLRLFSRLRYESYDSDDWAQDGVTPATIPTVLSLGAEPFNYDVFLIELGVEYAFGGDR